MPTFEREPALGYPLPRACVSRQAAASSAATLTFAFRADGESGRSPVARRNCVAVMPRRSNLFQDTIAVVHAHMAGDATIEESSMLRQRTTGELREVDVVLRSRIGSHEVVVSIEARASVRKADLPWVESMVGKHADLPTSKLVLVSENGFTGPAKRQAEAKGAIAVTSEDLAGDHPGRRIIDQLQSLQAEEVTLELQHMAMTARRPSGETTRVRVPLNMNVYDGNGRYITMLNLLFESERAASFAEFHRDLSSPGGALEANLHPPWNLPGGVVPGEIYARWEKVDPPELQLIEEVVVLADVAVEGVPTIEMTARQLGDIAYSYGEATLGGERALVVITADESGGRLTVRPRRR
jgi:hypothetical protein